MRKVVWLGPLALLAAASGIGLRYGVTEMFRPPVSGVVPGQSGVAVPADDPAAPFNDVARYSAALGDALIRAGQAVLAPGSRPGQPDPASTSTPAKPDPHKPDTHKPEAVKADAGKSEAVRAEPKKPEAAPSADLSQVADRFKAPAARPVVSAPIPDAPPAPPPGPTAFAPADQYPLTSWTLDYGEAGYAARLALNGAPLAGRSPGLGETLEVSGWAGDSLIGIRFSHVLAAVCGKVVGAAPVQEPTPDIARTIHSNLSMAGWSLRLPVELLPRCDRPVLTVLAVRDGKFAYPLRGEHPLVLPAETVKAPASATVRPLRPGDLPFLDRQPLTLSAKPVTVRRCAASDCAPLGALAPGEYSVAVMDRQKGWVLLVTPSLSGWVPDSVLRPPPPVRKPAPPKEDVRPEDAKPEAKAPESKKPEAASGEEKKP